MYKTPSISLIIPVYNVEQFVEQCINSIKSQTLYDFEAIIVNDGSKDSSIEICERLIKGDNRFRIIHKENGGLMSAWKYGLKNATGDYIGFVDSDDWVDDNMYDVLYHSIIKYDADIVASGHIIEDNTSRKRWTREKLFVFEGKTIKEEFVRDYCCSYFQSISNPSICRWDKIYKKELLLSNIDLFNEKISLAEDFNTNIAVILDAKKIVLLPDFTPYHYRYNPNSIVNTINPKAFYNIKELGSTCDKIMKSKQVESVYIESFVGNVIFDEINRICNTVSFSNLNKNEIKSNLRLCNGFYYLNRYTTVRAITRIKLYNWFIQHGFIKIIKVFTILNRIRRIMS